MERIKYHKEIYNIDLVIRRLKAEIKRIVLVFSENGNLKEDYNKIIRSLVNTIRLLKLKKEKIQVILLKSSYAL